MIVSIVIDLFVLDGRNVNVGIWFTKECVTYVVT